MGHAWIGTALEMYRKKFSTLQKNFIKFPLNREDRRECSLLSCMVV